MKAYITGVIKPITMFKHTLLLLFLLCTCVLAAQTEKANHRNWKVGSERHDKLALVIGNSRYGGGQDLEGPSKNAEQMVAALNSQGYDVEIGYNLDYEEMVNAVRKFALRFHNYQEGIVYYAGHGIQVNGENYLIPIGAELKSPKLIGDHCYNVDRIFEEIKDSDKPKLVVLDACRENPFNKITFRDSLYRLNFAQKSVSRLRNASIVFSTAKTTTVADENIFTPAFSKRVRNGGCLEEILREVSEAVRKDDPNQIIDRAGILERQMCFGTVSATNANVRDTDGDGVFDDKDACVRAPGPEACSGCPMVPTLGWRSRVDSPGILDYYHEQDVDRLEMIGNAQAKARLGYMYRMGKGVGQDEQKAKRLFKSALEADGFAEYNLAILSLQPESGPPNEADALAYLQRGAELGDPYAHYNLGVYWLKNGKTKADEQLALKHFREAAKLGMVPANALAGEMYQFELTPQKLDAALDYYQRGADYNDPRALTDLARLYAEAQGVKQNFKESVRLYEKAVALGYVRAMLELGDLLYRKLGSKEEKIKASLLFQQACDAGSGEACRLLGNMYHMGKDVGKDREKALELHRRALELGDGGSKEYVEKYDKG